MEHVVVSYELSDGSVINESFDFTDPFDARTRFHYEVHSYLTIYCRDSENNAKIHATETVVIIESFGLKTTIEWQR